MTLESVGAPRPAAANGRRGAGYDGTLMPLVEQWLNERLLCGEITSNTERMVRYRFKGLVEVHGTRPPGELDRATIDLWRQRIGSRSVGTRHAYTCSVRVFCRWLVRQGVILSDPTLDLPRIREPKRVPRARRPEEIQLLLGVCRYDRDRLIVHLMVGLGLRCIEVAQLEVGDYDPAAGTVLVRGKFDSERLLPVPAPAVLALHTYLDHKGWSAGPLIRKRKPLDSREGLTPHGVSNLLTQLLLRAGIKKRAHDGAGAHSLRHTAASDVYERCRDPRVVQQMLGHSSLNTTQRYLRQVDLNELRSAMEGRPYAG